MGMSLDRLGLFSTVVGFVIFRYNDPVCNRRSSSDLMVRGVRGGSSPTAFYLFVRRHRAGRCGSDAAGCRTEAGDLDTGRAGRARRHRIVSGTELFIHTVWRRTQSSSRPCSMT